MKTQENTKQMEFFGVKGVKLDRKVIKDRNTFDGFFKNAKTIQAVTYVDSPELILEFFEENGLSKLEILVGQGNDYREELRGKFEVADKLERLKEEKKLLIYTSERVIHSKLYLVEYEGGEVKFIHTSANLTRTAQEARQINYAHIFSVDKQDRYYRDFLDDINEHKSFASLFLDDLTEEIKIGKQERNKIIEKWIIGEGIDVESKKVQKIQQEISKKAVTENPSSQKIVVSLENIPTKMRKKLDKQLIPIRHSFSDNSLRINRWDYIQATRKIYGLPLMSIDKDKIKYVLGQEVIERTFSLPNASHIDQSLQDLENYFNTVDTFGQTNRLGAVKINMFEALLYFFWSPFANQQMQIYNHYGAITEKGLPFLYIYGEPNSGKGTFTNFALKLITGKRTLSISANEISLGKLIGIKNWGTIFPLVIDDITTTKFKQLRGVLCDYWKHWDNNRFSPVIFTTNMTKPEDWLKERILRVDFDVRFSTEDPKGRARINKILDQDNSIFCWFSYLYLHREEDKMQMDILAPARNIFKELYKKAQRPLPKYFPEKPVEEVYGIGRLNWRKLFEQGKAQMKREDNNIRVNFKGLEYWEIKGFLKDLDKNIRAEKRGKEIIIKNPDYFLQWLGLPKKFRLKRILEKFGRKK